jgi:hypothetical protein
MSSTDDILNKYGAKIERQMKGFDASGGEKNFSKSYDKFRGEMIPEFTRYERWCKSIGNFFTIKVGDKDRERIEKAIYTAHLNVTASEVVVFSTMLLFFTLFGGILFFVALWLITDTFSLMFLFLVFIMSIFLFFYSSKTPERMATRWRLAASAEMVPAILYIVIYMKHTSNFEKAVEFASQHLRAPLNTDFRKIFWDVEVGRFSTIKESVDNYLLRWKDYSLEFVEAFHLIESSLYEPNEARRIATLEKSLSVILDGVYDKMLKYTHEAKAPLTNVYMLGIVLPTLALAILPLASTMMAGAIKWYHVLLIFNILIPFMVISMTEGVLMRRPGGYGESGLLKKSPHYSKYLSRSGYFKGALLAFPVFLIGIIPFLLRYLPDSVISSLGVARDYSWEQMGLGGILGSGTAFGIVSDGVLYGPSGPLSLLMSLCIPLSIAIVFIVGSRERTKDILETRNKYKEVEAEFTSSLFQLGNRIGDGSPAEVAFAKVASSVKGTSTEGFFRIVNENIGSLGMNLERALFDPKRGACVFYPSQLVATSMKILVESVKKGLHVAARSLMAISDYVKNIKKINDRLNDLLAEIISDMKSNMTFLAPLLSGIIVGLSGMISSILGALGEMFNNGEIGSSGAFGNIGDILGLFDPVSMIPTYWLQIVVGIYLIQVVFILTSTLVTIKSGRDPVQEVSEIGKNLKTSITLYFIVSLLSVVGLTLVGAFALASLG